MERCLTADKHLGHYIDQRTDLKTAFNRMPQQAAKCGFGVSGTCCKLCSNGPCRITEKSPRGVCGATADTIVARNFLRSVAAGAACYLHVAEATAQRLQSIAEGRSPLQLRSTAAIDSLAATLQITGQTPQEKALAIAQVIQTDLYRARNNKMQLVKHLAPAERLRTWNELGIMPGGAKAEVFDALVKTSTNLNTDPVDLLLHALSLGICTGFYGLEMTNLMNDIIMGEPEIGTAATGFSVVSPDYINIAVSGHSHSVFAGLIALLETAEGQAMATAAGAKGIRLVGLTCVGQDMQSRNACVKTEVFSGQAGNNFTQELLLGTGAIDLVVSEFNCTFAGIEPIAEKYRIKLVCLDDVSKQSTAELLVDQHGQELQLAKTICEMAVRQYRQRRPEVAIRMPSCHGCAKVVTGVGEKSLTKFLGGNLQPLIDLIKNGTIKGIAGVLGCSNLAAGGHDVTTAELTRDLISRDILVLSAGCTTGGLANCGFCSPEAADWAGPGLQAVCRKLGIPPVLNFGPCLGIGRIEMVAAQLAQEMGISLPELPVVISAPQWLEEQALADGCFGLSLGLTLHLSQPPAILGSSSVTTLLTEDLVKLTGGRVMVEGDPHKAAEQIAQTIAAKLAKLA